ncbi:hypothetical protein K449DRAFT_429613 [Hypoxylon sp. EC38]|nr:hypothetical protein K449DRAFT_429613 [Hypoxylon sp. EC38]
MSHIFARTFINLSAGPEHRRLVDGIATESKAVEQLYRVDSAVRKSMCISDLFDTEAEGSPPSDVDGIPKHERTWDYGKKACPGRWYASLTIKICLAYMILNYKIELVDKLPKRKSLVECDDSAYERKTKILTEDLIMSTMVVKTKANDDLMTFLFRSSGAHYTIFLPYTLRACILLPVALHKKLVGGILRPVI